MIAVLRRWLCSRGVAWPVADTAARRAVEHALQVVGAERPPPDNPVDLWTERLIARRHCVTCGGALTGAQREYCSPQCLHIAYRSGGGGKGSRAGGAPADSVLPTRQRLSGAGAWPDLDDSGREICRECRTLLAERHDLRRQLYCSRACSMANFRRRAAEQTAALLGLLRCRHCGAHLDAKHTNKQYCSRRCQKQARRKRTRSDRDG
ncbi:MAG: hypothetical protein ACREJ5_04405 [Geminicoccaceae bacterium]